MDVRLFSAVVAGTVSVVVVGCGFIFIPLDLDSGIAGTILAGPQCPVVGPNTAFDCNDKPLSATVIVRWAATGWEVTRFTSGADGTFRVPLYPGTYLLDPQPGSPSGLPHAPPQTVEVQPGAFTEVTIDYDTGIR
jgi:hypothetical protein